MDIKEENEYSDSSSDSYNVENHIIDSDIVKKETEIEDVPMPPAERNCVVEKVRSEGGEENATFEIQEVTSWNNEMRKKLIQLVYNEPSLWRRSSGFDQKSLRHYNALKWREISRVFGTTDTSAQIEWVKMKRSFYNRNKMILINGKFGKADSKYSCFFESLSFLEENRQTTSKCYILRQYEKSGESTLCVNKQVQTDDFLEGGSRDALLKAGKKRHQRTAEPNSIREVDASGENKINSDPCSSRSITSMKNTATANDIHDCQSSHSTDEEEETPTDHREDIYDCLNILSSVVKYNSLQLLQVKKSRCVTLPEAFSNYLRSLMINMPPEKFNKFHCKILEIVAEYLREEKQST
ncbi:uncharacterized protein LOC132260433 [Phlebotomus argentipes]|uniref:uncharacterized protein LOC132260433 n=1 Tax=Phlebotomus argentipes TaxID=94469 RepID=UPI002893530B|nr:uncharacterized protein LOC132260433 [Phlebotomus argentipes]